MSVSRREFLEAAALSGLAVNAAMGAEVDKKTGMPTRVLGRTGARVSVLAFGSGSRWLMYKEEDKAAEAINRALDQGITYVDTAYSYGNGQSEERIGKFVKHRRKDFWLATKLSMRPGDEAMRQFEGCLKRLQTDHVDLVHIHSLTTEEDLKKIEAKGNVLDVIRKLRDQKVARFIGITSHTNPEVLRTALERHDFDCTQMALNAAQIGNSNLYKPKAPGDSFESLALPVAVRKKMGIIAMKVFAQEKILSAAPIEKLIRYSLSLPVTAAVAGMPKLEHIDENIRVAKAFKPFSREEMKSLAQEVAGKHKVAVDEFFRDHIDA